MVDRQLPTHLYATPGLLDDKQNTLHAFAASSSEREQPEAAVVGEDCRWLCVRCEDFVRDSYLRRHPSRRSIWGSTATPICISLEGVVISLNAAALAAGMREGSTVTGQQGVEFWRLGNAEKEALRTASGQFLAILHRHGIEVRAVRCGEGYVLAPHHRERQDAIRQAAQDQGWSVVVESVEPPAQEGSRQAALAPEAAPQHVDTTTAPVGSHPTWPENEPAPQPELGGGVWGSEDLEATLSQADPSVLRELPPEIVAELRRQRKSQRRRQGIAAHFVVQDPPAGAGRAPHPASSRRKRSRRSPPREHGPPSTRLATSRVAPGALGALGQNSEHRPAAAKEGSRAPLPQRSAMFEETDFKSLRPVLGPWIKVAGPVAPVVLQGLVSQWVDQGQLEDVAALLRFVERTSPVGGLLATVERSAQAHVRGRYGGPLGWRR